MTNAQPDAITAGAARLSAHIATRIHLLATCAGQVQLLAPANPDALLDDPETHARYKADNYMPYWPVIWPSSLMMANYILSATSAPPVTTPGQTARTIELGCGLGLAGIAAAQRGWEVLFTDYDAKAVEFAEHNALRNGIPSQLVRTAPMDWRAPVAEKFTWIIASDVLYERRLHPLLLGAIEALLAPGGVAWVSDPQRRSAEDFPLEAVSAGFAIKAEPLEGKDFAGQPQCGTLYRVWKKK